MDKSFSDAVISVYKLLVVLAVPKTLICFQLCEIQLNSYIGAGCKRCITTFVYRHPMLSSGKDTWLSLRRPRSIPGNNF